jgi:hypothetical protein
VIEVHPRRRGENKFGPAGGSLFYRAIATDPANEGLAEVREAVGLQAPPEYDGFSLSGIEATEVVAVGPRHLYHCEARYGAGSGFTALPTNTLVSYAGTLTTETMNRSHAVVSSGRSGGAGPAPDHDQLIRVNKDGQAEGTAVLRPVWTTGYTREFSQQEIDGLLGNLVAAFGTVNAQPFKVFPAGTLLFQGLSIEQQATGRYAARYEFGYRRNEAGVPVGDGMSADVAGWDFLEISPTADFDDALGIVVARAGWYFVHRLYEFVAWGDLGV